MQRMQEIREESKSQIQSLERDLDDVKQSNANFAKENRDLMKERDGHVATINSLNGQITQL